MTNEGNVPPQEAFFRVSGTGNAAWEIDRPQSVIKKLVEQGYIHGNVLDIGCGIGDNAIFMAQHLQNVTITAIDLVPKAIEVAREKAQRANVDIQFEVVDMLEDLSKSNLRPNSFDVVLDSAIFHGFSDDNRQRYIKNIEHLIKPNGLYIQIVFSEWETREGGPRRIKKSDLMKIFASENGWKIESIEECVYELQKSTPLGEGADAYLSLIRRL